MTFVEVLKQVRELLQGKRTEAHKLLSDLYNCFTEGFDTKDLQEAKMLLDELGANGDGDSSGRERA